MSTPMISWTPIVIDHEKFDTSKGKAPKLVKVEYSLGRLVPSEWAHDFNNPSSYTLSRHPPKCSGSTIVVQAEVDEVEKYIQDIEDRVTYANKRYAEQHLPKLLAAKEAELEQQRKADAVIQAAADKIKAMKKKKDDE